MNWYTISELQGATGLPSSRLGIKKLAERESWNCRLRRGTRGGGYEYSVISMPVITQQYFTNLVQNEVIQVANGAGRGTRLASSISFSPEPPQPKEGKLIRMAGARSDREVRLKIANNFYEFIQSHPQLGLSDAAQRFTQMYNDGQVQSPTQSPIPSFHWGTLLRWYKVINQPMGFTKLAANYGKNKNTNKFDAIPEIKTFLIACLGDKPSNIHRELKKRFTEVVIPSLATLRRWVSKFAKEFPDTWIEVTEGTGAYNNKCRPSYGNASQQLEYANQLVEIDATPTDFLLADGKRYAIIGAIDVFSRKVTATLAEVSNAQNISQGLLFSHINTNGVPDTIATDQGKDFISDRVKAGLRGCGIHHKICDGHAPWQKPHIERWFGTMAMQFAEQLPGYCGHNVEQRKKRQQRLDKEQKAGLFLVKEQAQAKLEEYVISYNNTVHSSIEMTPIDKYNSSPVKPRFFKDPSVLSFLLDNSISRKGIRKVGKKGVRVGKHHYQHPQLVHWNKKAVSCKHSFSGDAGILHIYAPSDNQTGEYICDAVCPELSGLDCAEFREQTREEKKKNRAAAKAIKKAQMELAKGGKITPTEVTNLVAVTFDRDVVKSKQTVQIETTVIEIAIQAQANEPTPKTPKTEAVRNNIVNLQQQREAKPKVEDSTRYKELRIDRDGGRSIDPDEAEWMAGYERTNRGKQQKQLLDSHRNLVMNRDVAATRATEITGALHRCEHVPQCDRDWLSTYMEANPDKFSAIDRVAGNPPSRQVQIA